jgi:hypothetical protein
MISGALTLLANAVIAYNTWKLHRVLERRKASGRHVPSDEILAHIAPIGFRHITFHGAYRFPLELEFPDFPDTEVRWDDDLGGVGSEGGVSQESSTWRLSG